MAVTFPVSVPLFVDVDAMVVRVSLLITWLSRRKIWNLRKNSVKVKKFTMLLLQSPFASTLCDQGELPIDVSIVCHEISGVSGRVFKGIYKGQHQVAIKVLKSSDKVDEFKKEFLIMRHVRVLWMKVLLYLLLVLLLWCHCSGHVMFEVSHEQ